MGQDRLSSLVLLSCEHDLAKELNYDSVINALASARARKFRLSSVLSHHKLYIIYYSYK